MQLTLEAGASVAEVARAHGLNANQVFKWKRAFERGELVEPCSALLPVTIAGRREPAGEVPIEEQPASAGTGSIHIEFPGRATVSIESGADSSLVRQVLESLRK